MRPGQATRPMSLDCSRSQARSEGRVSPTKTGGLPCRYPRCDTVFHVAHGDNLDELRQAGAERVDHEVAAHQYHHQTQETPGSSAGFQLGSTSRTKPQRR